MRAFGTAAFLLLHIILCIGPLCRLNPKFLPLLYNRRHAGVTCFLLALVHAVMVVATYHAGGDINPILSIFVSSPLTGSRGGRAVSTVRIFCAGDFIFAGRDQPRFLAGQFDRPGLEGAAHGRFILPTRCWCCTSRLAHCKARRAGFMSQQWRLAF